MKENRIFKIINKSAVKSLMDDKPSGLRIFEAFEGQWDKLTDEQLIEVAQIIWNEAQEMFKLLDDITHKRMLQTGNKL